MKKFLLPALAVFFLVSRLTNLTLLPVFADEAIYVRWAQLMNDDWSRWLFFPIQDGKTPLYMWILRYFLQALPLQPLLATRLLSVVAGGLSTIMVFFLTQKLFSKQYISWLAAFLYVLLPITFFHDRMGLIDSMLLFFSILTLYALVCLKRKPTIKHALFAGAAWGLAIITKVPGLFLAPSFVVAWLVLDETKLPWKWSKKELLNKVSEAYYFAGAGIFGLLILLSLRKSPVFPSLFTRGGDFTYSISEVLLGARFDIVFINIWKVISWLSMYISPLSFLLIFALLLLPKWSKSKHYSTILFLVLAFVGYLFPYILLGKVIRTRYFLPVMAGIIPLVAYGIYQLYDGKDLIISTLKTYHKKLGVAVIILILLQSIQFQVIAFTNPNNIPFTKDDRSQYLQEWSSGHGIVQIRDFLREQAQNQKIVVGTEGSFGTLPDGLFMYFAEDPLLDNMEIIGLETVSISAVPEALVEKSIDYDTYMVVNSHRYLDETQTGVELIKTYPRPNNSPSLLLFKVE